MGLNKSFRIIWSYCQSAWVVVGECTAGKGKSKGKSLRCQILLAAPAYLLMHETSLAQVQGLLEPTVRAGQAYVSQTSPNRLVIEQQSQRAVIDWKNFSIAQGQSLQFIQPSARSIALNRVTGQQASIIEGQLSANGQVWVLNPQGVIIGKQGRVDTQGFLATTLGLSNEDFLQGSYRFSMAHHSQGSATATGVIQNNGTINTPGAYAVLASDEVINNGLIQARLGTIALASGEAMTLDFAGDQLLRIDITEPIRRARAGGFAIENLGMLSAQGGQVLLTARGTKDVLNQAINTQGLIEATSAKLINGSIVLDGGASGLVQVDGSLNVSGMQAGERGGSVRVIGAGITLSDKAMLDARGDLGGGIIHLGGGWQGALAEGHSPAIRNYVAAGATLDASAVNEGNGGEIVVWSDVKNSNAHTWALGTFAATGGLLGGHGGRIETSGYGLSVNGIRVNAAATSGKAGEWLLDPVDITISDQPTNISSGVFGGTGTESFVQVSGLFGGTSDNSGLYPGTSGLIGSTDFFSQNSTTTVISPSTITSGLTSSNVTIRTANGSTTGSGNIYINSNINFPDISNRTLYLLADGVITSNSSSITINGPASTTNKGTVVFAQGGNSSFQGRLTRNLDFVKSGVGELTLTQTQWGTSDGQAAFIEQGSLITNANNNQRGTLGYASDIVIGPGAEVRVSGQQQNSYVGTDAYPRTTIEAGGKLRDASNDSGQSRANHLGEMVLAGGSIESTNSNTSWATWLFDKKVTAKANTLSSISGGNMSLNKSSEIAVEGNAELYISSNINSYTDTGFASIGNRLLKTEAGTLTLSGNNTFTGGTTINGGTLSISSDANLGTAPGTSTTSHLVLNGGTLAYTGSGALNPNRGISLGTNGGTINVTSALSYGGIMADASGATGSLTKSGTGILTLSGANTYLGRTDVVQGTLVIKNQNYSPRYDIESDGALEINVESGTTLDMQKSTTFSGGGILRKTGYGKLLWGTSAATFALDSMSFIEVSEGTFIGGSSANEIWTNNKSNLIVSAGATFNGVEANVRVNALYGAGEIKSGHSHASYANFTFGVDGGSGNFQGSLKDESSSANFVKVGSGTQTLSGYNTYTGTTTISGGTLQIGDGGNLGSLYSSSIINNAGLNFNRSNDLTYAGTISGSGIVTKLGGGTLTLSGNNTYAGNTNVLHGNLVLQGYPAQLSSVPNYNIYNNGTLTFGRSDVFGIHSANIQTVLNIYDGGIVTNSGSSYNRLSALNFLGNGILTSTGSASGMAWALAGGVTVAAGKTASITGTGAVQLGSNTVTGTTFTTDNGSNLSVSANLTDGSTTMWPNPQNSSFLTKLGNGTLTLSGNNTFRGGTTINGGTLSISSDANLGTAPGTSTPSHLVLNGGTLAYTGSGALNANRGISLGTNGGTINVTSALSYGGIIANASGATGSLTKSGPGELKLSGNNTYTGATNVFAGTLGIYANPDPTNNIPGSVGTGTLTLSGGSKLSVGPAVTAITNNIVLGSGGGSIEFAPMDLEYLIVGGGGGGGTRHGGGGGGGLVAQGVISLNPTTFTTSIPITVGSGGEGATNTSLDNTVRTNTSGGTSSLGIFSAAGGKSGVYYGFSQDQGAGPDGGWNRPSPSGSTTTGGSGRTGTNESEYAGGGGGGAGGAGSAATLGNGGNGGIGVSSSITGTLTSYGGGGGGSISSVSVGIPGSGGSGGGGDGSKGAVAATSGTNRLGGGGGAGGFSDRSQGLGGNGGSGTVIVRYLGPEVANGGVASPGIALAKGYTLHTFSITEGQMTSGSFSFIPKVSPNAVTVSGNISGSGNLNLNALGGSFTFLGDNTYTGTTTINAGTLQIGAGGTTGSLTSSSIINNAGLNFNRSNDLNYAGTISGAGTVTKLGGGALTLSGSNTYSGTTTVSEGTLQIGAGGTSGDLTSVSIINNALLSFSRSDDLIYAGTISGSGTFTKSGTGTLTLSGNNTYSGTTTISGGTLQIGAGDASGSLLSNSIINNAALSFNRSDSYNYGGSISGTGILTKAGVGTLTLSSNNTYSGTTTVSEGTLQIGAGGTSGSLTSSSIINNAWLNFNRSNDLTYAGTISGPGIITKLGNGSLTLSGNNTYSGGTTISGGILNIGTQSVGSLGAITSSAIGTGSIAIQNGAALNLLGHSIYNPVVMAGDGVVTYGGIATGALFNSSNSPSAAHGPITLTGNASIRSYNGTLLTLGSISGNSYSLSLQNSQSLNTSGVIGSDTSITASGLFSTDSTLINSTPQEVVINGQVNLNTLSSPWKLTINGDLVLTSLNLGGSLTLNSNGASQINGVIANASGAIGSLTKSGSGTLTLSGNNTYSGGTALEQGLIRLGSSTQVTNRLITAGPIGTGALDVKSGATLDLNGNTLANALVLSGQGQSNQGALINTSTSAATVLGDITLTADTTMATRGDLVFSSIDGTTGLGNSASLGIKTQPLSQWTSLTISSDSSDPYRLTLKTSPSLGLGPGDVVRFSKLVGGKLSEGFGVVTSVNDAAASELSIRTDFKIAGSSEFSIDKVDTTAPKLSLKSLESNASSRITIDRALALGGLTVDSQVALKVTGQQIATIGSQSFSGPVVIDNASIGGPCASTWLLECYFNEQIFSNPTVFSSLKGSIDFQSTLNSYTASPSNRSVLITHGNVAGVSTENPALRFSDSVGVQGEFGAFIAKAPSIAIGPTNSSLKAKAIELKVAPASGITAIPSVILNGQVTLEPTVSRLTITSEGGSLVTSGGFLSKAIDQELSISLASTTSGVNTAGTLWADKSWASPQLPFGQVTVTASKFSSYGSEFCSVLDPLNCSAKSQTVSVYTNKLHAKLESPTSVLRDEFLINKAAAEEAAAKAAAEAAAKKAAEEAAAKAAAEAAAKKAAEEVTARAAVEASRVVQAATQAATSSVAAANNAVSAAARVPAVTPTPTPSTAVAATPTASTSASQSSTASALQDSSSSQGATPSSGSPQSSTNDASSTQGSTSPPSSSPSGSSTAGSGVQSPTPASPSTSAAASRTASSGQTSTPTAASASTLPAVPPSPPSPVPTSKPPTPKDNADASDRTLASVKSPQAPKPASQAQRVTTKLVAVSGMVVTQVSSPPALPPGSTLDQNVPALPNPGKW